MFWQYESAYTAILIEAQPIIRTSDSVYKLLKLWQRRHTVSRLKQGYRRTIYLDHVCERFPYRVRNHMVSKISLPQKSDNPRRTYFGLFLFLQ